MLQLVSKENSRSRHIYEPLGVPTGPWICLLDAKPAATTKAEGSQNHLSQRECDFLGIGMIYITISCLQGNFCLHRVVK